MSVSPSRLPIRKIEIPFESFEETLDFRDILERLGRKPEEKKRLLEK